ncbi:5808_t:CDS:2, partial [Scutellospora calospora]
ISYGWCKFCESEHMRLSFKKWKSGNKFIDLLIQRTQLNALHAYDYLEFINFDNIEINECISRGGFSSVYKGYWLDGPRWLWDDIEDSWNRNGPIQLETYLHCLHSGSMADCFGITRDETGCFMFVMRYYENGNLYEYLDNNGGIIGWRDITDILWGIAATGRKPYYNRPHNQQLAYEICYKNLRPEISEELKSEMPEEYYNLMIQCWDSLPENRPTANQLNKLLGDWITAICDDPNPSQISDSFGIAEEKRWESITKEIENKKLSTYSIHKDAIYFS